MKVLIPLGLIFLIIIVGYQLYTLSGQGGIVEKKFNELEARLQKIISENSKIEEDLKYYSNQDNLEKEARSEFNYIRPGEKTIIIVPEKSSTP